MSNFFLLNGHQPYPFAKGELNATLQKRTKDYLLSLGHEVRESHVAEDYDVDEEIAHHIWADTIIMQFPVNWMSISWAFKKYQDEVYTAGMDGRLCQGDGRTKEEPKKNYGMGGSLGGTRYMLSATLNAPAEAFNDPSEPFFKGMSLDDLLAPVHLNAKFFGMTPLPTFAAFDVMKNPDIETDLKRHTQHLNTLFGKA